MSDPVSPRTQKISSQERQKVTHDITVYGMVMDFFLSLGKLVTGILFHSSAVVADGLHSLSDMVSDLMVLAVNRFSHEDPDQDHPYGHARFETLGTVCLGVLLLGVGLIMAYEYGRDLFIGGSEEQASWLALAMTGLSLVGKEWQYRFTLAAAKRIRSPLLEANAWHSRSDSLSSVVVFFGVLAALAGYPALETLAAIFVAVLICKMGFSLTWDALQELVDKGIPADLEKECEDILRAIPGVKNIHMLRGRLMSQQIFLDVHIQVSSDMSVSEGHQIGDWAMAALRQHQEDIKDITLHIDHEEDDLQCPIVLAPLRPEIIDTLKKYPEAAHFEDMVIHYHQQLVSLDLIFADNTPLPPRQVLDTIVENTDWLTGIGVLINKS